jgi:predicted RNase H-like nuclease
MWVLGIDAAWKLENPSGIALLDADSNRPRIVRAAPSYASFLTGFDTVAANERLNPQHLLAVCAEITQATVDIVAIDLPMSHTNIAQRRVADDAVSRAFGRAGAATHSPNASRPGPWGRELQKGFENQGFSLMTNGQRHVGKSLVEVYPLAALCRLMRVQSYECRPKYKYGKRYAYWKDESPRPTALERRERLCEEWRHIVSALKAEIDTGEDACVIPHPTERSLKAYKGYEDRLDAIICAWVGWRFLRKDTTPFGDDAATIWVPNAHDDLPS